MRKFKVNEGTIKATIHIDSDDLKLTQYIEYIIKLVIYGISTSITPVSYNNTARLKTVVQEMVAKLDDATLVAINNAYPTLLDEVKTQIPNNRFGIESSNIKDESN